MSYRSYGMLAFVTVMLLGILGVFLYRMWFGVASVHGVYVFHGQQSIGYFEFRGDDANLSAQVQGVELQPDGFLISRRGVAMGSVKGSNIALTLRLNGTYNTSLAYSGTVEPDRLLLTLSMGGKPMSQQEFVRSSRRKYEAYEAELKQKAQAMIGKAKAEEEAQRLQQGKDVAMKSLTGIGKGMQTFYGMVDAQVAQAQDMLSGFVENTKRSARLYQQFEQTQDWDKRSKLVFELGTVPVGSEQINLAINKLRDDLYVQIRLVDIGLVEAQQTCDNYKSGSAQLEVWCSNFAASKAAYQQKSQQTQKAFGDMAAVFHQELKKQRIFFRQADNLLGK